MFIDYLHIAKQAELKPQNRLQRRDMFMTVIIPRVECFTASRGCEVLGEHDREMRCACANRRAAVSILPQRSSKQTHYTSASCQELSRADRPDYGFVPHLSLNKALRRLLPGTPEAESRSTSSTMKTRIETL
jgi:hypothetical protein